MSGGTTGTPSTTPAALAALLPAEGAAPLPLPFGVREDLRVQWSLLGSPSPATAMRYLRLETAALALAYPAWARQVAPRASLAGSRYDLMALGDAVLEQWIAALPAGTDEGAASYALAARGAATVEAALTPRLPTSSEVAAQVNFTGPGGGG